jgi:hypothetical protein
MRSIARAPLEVGEFDLRTTAASPTPSEGRTHQRGNALLAGRLKSQLPAPIPRR